MPPRSTLHLLYLLSARVFKKDVPSGCVGSGGSKRRLVKITFSHKQGLEKWAVGNLHSLNFFWKLDRAQRIGGCRHLRARDSCATSKQEGKVNENEQHTVTAMQRKKRENNQLIETEEKEKKQRRADDRCSKHQPPVYRGISQCDCVQEGKQLIFVTRYIKMTWIRLLNKITYKVKEAQFTAMTNSQEQNSSSYCYWRGQIRGEGEPKKLLTVDMSR